MVVEGASADEALTLPMRPVAAVGDALVLGVLGQDLGCLQVAAVQQTKARVHAGGEEVLAGRGVPLESPDAAAQVQGGYGPPEAPSVPGPQSLVVAAERRGAKGEKKIINK